MLLPVSFTEADTTSSSAQGSFLSLRVSFDAHCVIMKRASKESVFYATKPLRSNILKWIVSSLIY